ncbi:hypothetical protein [Marinicella gelatinilytica]|uniref:hypothetical protein n=1 Tax=Marinicella gelatinilytica TaxID=2996017 RepID=UPI002260D071|nr:hypothetical protein [Marinicella gelatinilytica]MCX7544548.1 hypothetical protein [Marinicella gelatinilytica]
MTAHLLPADATSEKINNISRARYILNQLDQHHPRLGVWCDWANTTFAEQTWLPYLTDIMQLAYARMCHRNGSLSQQPRSYHNEFHCNDLCEYLIESHNHFSDMFSPAHWALLSYFAVCHDLQQGLPNDNRDHRLVGANEAASFQEARQMMDLIMPDNKVNSLCQPQHILLLKTMIEGSTFGRHGDNKRYFFQGNIAKHLLNSIELENQADRQLVYLACDIDTANVSMPFNDYARSAIRVYDELKAHRLIKVSARAFFSDEQLNYFFKQQQFNSKPALELFEPRKQRNAPLLRETVAAVKALPEDADTETVKHTFFRTAEHLSIAS